MRIRLTWLRRWLLAAALVPASSVTVRADQPAPPRLFTAEHTAMATRWQLLLYVDDQARADELSTLVFEEIDRIEDLLSNYRPFSELSRINREAARQPVTTDPETFNFLAVAEHWSRQSDGAFDMTVGPLMHAWGFFRHSGRLPSPTELARLRSAVGWRKVQLDAKTRTVHFRSPGVELDPGGIGKGFAVDAALRLLRAEGVRAAMLSAGSSTIGAIGAPPGEPGWRVTEHDPAASGRALSSILLRDTTLSSANCAEKSFTLAGHRYCHIMDPRLLRPVVTVQQVTVLDPSGTGSDALSNALFVLTPAQSIRLLRALPQDRALIVSGTPDRRVCTAIRWQEPIAPGVCDSMVRTR